MSPKIFTREDEPDLKVGDSILARLSFTTLGAVWNIVSRSTGAVIAKARVVKDYSKDEKFTDVPKYIDPRSEGGRDDTFNAGKHVFGLRIEKTNDDESLYS